jgi:5-formyltetrahydrofolate cyclo-ligase
VSTDYVGLKDKNRSIASLSRRKKLDSCAQLTVRGPIRDNEGRGGVAMNAEKKAFREQQIAKLQAQAQATQAAGEGLLAKLTQLPSWQAAKTVGMTVSNPFEVPTAPIMAAALAAGKQVLIPRCLPKRQMAFLPDPGPGQRIKSAFGIPEPAYDEAQVNDQPDLLIVPGIAYALDTHARIGFGGGYYDRFLQRYQGPTVVLAAPVMAYATAAWPVEDHDVKIDQILTID